jgi:hypothetical protein
LLLGMTPCRIVTLASSGFSQELSGNLGDVVKKASIRSTRS